MTLLRRALLVACLLGAGSAAAHDSWLAPLPSTGAARLAFSTGNRYPLAESAPPVASIATAACRDGAGRQHALRPREGGVLQSTRARGALACWATLREHEITLEGPLVDVYLKEIRPGAAALAHWSAMAERGEPWVERYRKFARVELAPPDAKAHELRALRGPAGLPLEVVIVGDAPVRVGQPVAFRVLAHGQPVEGLALELVSERSPIGVWMRSDAQGRLQSVLPFGGQWAVRGTLLEAADRGWSSRFVTLVFTAR